MVFWHLLMTIYITQKQCFYIIACGWNLFYDFSKIVAVNLKYIFFSSWIYFQHFLYILNLGFSIGSEEGKYFPLYSCIHTCRFWLGVATYYALLLLTIYWLCSCNWSLNYFYWKSCVTCSFLENVSLVNLKLPYQCCFYINRIRWIEPNDLALSLFLIKNFTGGGFRCIYQVLFE